MPRVDDRRVLPGIGHALKSGGRWSDCPEHVYGSKKTRCNQFLRWAERGVWERIFAELAGVDGVPEKIFIDTSSIKGHRTRGGQKGGLPHGIVITKGGRNTKRHAVWDAKGSSHILLLTPDNTHDAKVAFQPINTVPPSDYLVAD
ncbi:transposase [Rhizorhapis sp. SPR117]|nr:transposase [Rhizorhapis sp. SPR117]